jgi:hypothetical protein
MTHLTERDWMILRDFFKVRVQTEQQIVATYWPVTPAGRKNGQRRLAYLAERGVLVRHVLHVKQVTAVEPLYWWAPGEEEPDCSELSRESRRRWQLPALPTAVLVASARLRNVLGISHRSHVHALSQLSHDLGVSALFHHLRRTNAQIAARYLSEDELPPGGFQEAQPDAVLIDEGGAPALALEFAADYDRDRFRRLHATLSARQLTYQIWGAKA